MNSCVEGSWQQGSCIIILRIHASFLFLVLFFFFFFPSWGAMETNWNFNFFRGFFSLIPVLSQASDTLDNKENR